MKDQILKIAKVKNVDEFYRKFPTEEAFQKAHGKEFRKAKLGSAIPKAQKGVGKNMYQEAEDVASKKQKCGLNDDDKQAGKEARALAKEPDAVEIPIWDDITNPQGLRGYPDPETSKKKQRDAFNDNLTNQYNLALSKYPNLTMPEYIAALRDSQRYSGEWAHEETRKAFDPKTGALLVGKDPRNYTPYQKFYQSKYPGQYSITPDQVLDVFSKMPGGFSNYSKYANVGYVPPMQRQGGQTKKLKQLTSFEGDIDNIIPTAQGGIGLNSPAGGTMSLPTSTANQFAGINTAGTYQMDPNQTGTLDEQISGSAGAVNPNNLLGKLGGVAGIAQTAGDLIGGFQMLKEQKKLRKQTEQGKAVSELTLKASGTRDVDIPNMMTRNLKKQRDVMFQPIQPNQLSPSYGTGYNAGFAAKNGATLRAEDGMQIGGNLGEIQNTYAPNNLYDDLGYEPLSESEMVKQYYAGGFVPQAKFGMSDFISGGGAGLVDQGIGAAFGGESGGGKIGGALGKTAGTLLGGPVGGFIGGALGKIAGNILDPNARKIKANQEAMQKNLQTAGVQSGMQALQQGQYSAYVRDGGNIPHGEYGWVSHDWQPQVITHFGEHKVSDLLKRDPMMDTLRTGGHIRQNNMYPQDQYALGGSLKTTWGGYAEPISRNPYEASETGIFRGKSHEESDGNGHTGIGVKYGDEHHDSYTDYAEYGTAQADADVEVERGEPYKQDSKGNMRVAGNLVISKEAALDAGNIKFAKQKYKNAIKDMAFQDKKYTKNIDNASSKLAKHSDTTPTGILERKSLAAIIEGNLMKLKNNKIASDVLFAHQDATNETAEEYGADADALAKGKFVPNKEAMKQQAKYGKEIFKAQTGTTYTGSSIVDYLKSIGQPIDKASRKKLAESKGIKNYTGTIDQNEQLLKALRDEASKAQTAQPTAPAYTSKKGVPTLLNPSSQLGPFDGYDVDTDWARSLYDPNAPSPVDANAIQRVVPPYSPDYTGPYDPAAVAAFDRNAKAPAPTKEEKKKGKFDWITAANALIPYLRPTDQEPLDANQLMGEMFALSANQLEPVPTQSVQYQLATPYDISYQDQLNEITAQTRDAMRMAGGDPSALAAISAQANRAKSQVLGEQFRQNQAQRMGTYNQNLQTLKEQQVQNLGLYDKQYERQATARSKTKATAQEALSSISDKIARNKLENRTLGIYENLYNYRFGPDGRAINMNPLAQFTAQVGDGSGKTGGLASGYEFTYDASGNIVGTRRSKKDDDAKNGKIVRAIKNL